MKDQHENGSSLYKTPDSQDDSFDFLDLTVDTDLLTQNQSFLAPVRNETLNKRDQYLNQVSLFGLSQDDILRKDGESVYEEMYRRLGKHIPQADDSSGMETESTSSRTMNAMACGKWTREEMGLKRVDEWHMKESAYLTLASEQKRAKKKRKEMKRVFGYLDKDQMSSFSEETRLGLNEYLRMNAVDSSNEQEERLIEMESAVEARRHLEESKRQLEDRGETGSDEYKAVDKCLRRLDRYKGRLKTDDLADPENTVSHKRRRGYVHRATSYYRKNEKGKKVGEPIRMEIDCSKENVRGEGNYIDKSGVPLFTHEPAVSDIKQGCIGDCYLMAGLTAIVHQDPKAILNCMRDNGNSVTVRFYLFHKDGTPYPLYVTVNKHVCDHGAYTSLWVQTFERAYAAGQICRRSHFKGGSKVSKRSASYETLEGGYPGDVMSCILGKRKQTTDYNKYTKRKWAFRKKHQTLLQQSTLGVQYGKGLLSEGFLAATEKQLEDVSEKYKAELEDAQADKQLKASRYDAVLLEARCQALGLDAPQGLDVKAGATQEQSQRAQTLDNAVKILQQNVQPLLRNNLKGQRISLEYNGKVACRFKQRGLTVEEVAQELKKAIKGLAWKTSISKGLDQDALEVLKNLENAQLESILAGIGPVANLQYSSMSGRYTPQAEAAFADIEQALAGGKHVTCHSYPFKVGSSGKTKKQLEWLRRNHPDTFIQRFGTNGEDMTDGLAELHAYTVLGVETIKREENGPPIKLVKLRNPWADGGVVNQHKDNKYTIAERSEAMGGVMYLDINEFMRRMCGIEVV